MATKRYPSRIDIEVIVPMIIIGLLMGFIGPRWLQSPLSIVRILDSLLSLDFCVLSPRRFLYSVVESGVRGDRER